MPGPFTVRLAVRNDDLDSNQHVRGPVYLDYADHVRWAFVRAAGASLEKLQQAGVGPINLETTIRYRHELRAGDAVDVSCRFGWGDGKTGTVHQELRRAVDGVLVAEVEGVGGMLDLETRRLVPDPAAHWRRVVERPEMLGL
jgi:acyl-CoA thioester hydrolase